MRDRSHVNLARDYSSDGESTNFEENVPPKITLGDFIIHKKPQRRDGQKNQNNSKTSAVVDTKAAYHASSHTNTQDAQNVDAFNQEQPEQEQLDDMPMDAKEVKKNNKKFHKPNRKDKEPQKRRAARSNKKYKAINDNFDRSLPSAPFEKSEGDYSSDDNSSFSDYAPPAIATFDDYL